MVKVTPNIDINDDELVFSFMRSPGPGGQNVNKVETAVLLRFNVRDSSSLPELVRQRLLLLAGNRLTLRGEILIKATRYRTQERNKQDAVERLQALLIRAASIPKKRKKTKPTYAATQKRLATKKLHSKAKSRRGKITGDD